MKVDVLEKSVIIDEPTWLEVDLDKLSSNIARVRNHLPQGTKIMAVVKAQAYGIGAEMVAKTAVQNGVDMLAVGRFAEGVHLRRAGISHPILNFGYLTDSEIEAALDHDLTNTVYSIEIAQKLHHIAEQKNMTAKIHINIDTGMGRVGIIPHQITSFISKLKELDRLNIQGVYSHFPSADEEDKSFSLFQIEKFLATVEQILPQLKETPLLHMANTAAILGIPESHLQIVRQGISLYGAYGSETLPRDLQLDSVASLKTKIAMIKQVPAGTSISYGRTFTTEKPTTIATLPVGYADGVNRKLSNKGQVLIKGKRFPIVGAVTMDQIMIDVGNHTELEIGDVATVMGCDQQQEITPDEIASLTGTIAYEVLTSISARIPRVYLKNGKPIKVLRNNLI